MAKKIDSTFNASLNEKSESFINKMNSNMHFKSELSNDSTNFDWVDEVEVACPFIDNIIRSPKLTLVREEETVKIEKAKKTSVASVKNLTKNTHYIDKLDEVTNEVQPSRILIERSEETFNTYENRFIYTLIDNLVRFVNERTEELDAIKLQNDKVLEYAATTIAGNERINVELKICANQLPNDKEEPEENALEKEIAEVRKRIVKINEYITSWKRSEMIKALVKARAIQVKPPIKMTNLILKNPNFQIASKLWSFLQSYYDYEANSAKQGLDTTGDNLIVGVLDDAFLMDYFVLDSISSSKKEQKQKLAQYAEIMIRQQIKRTMNLLLNSGIKITDQEILDIVTNELKNEKNRKTVDSTDVKNKFKSAFDEYLEKIQELM